MWNRSPHVPTLNQSAKVFLPGDRVWVSAQLLDTIAPLPLHSAFHHHEYELRTMEQ